MADPLVPRRRLLCDEEALARLERLARDLASDSCPVADPAVLVVSRRPSRIVARTTIGAAHGAYEVHLKVRRRPRAFDALRDALRPPRGPSEGSVLLALAARGVAVPRVVAWSACVADGLDLLVTETAPGRDLRALARDRLSRAERSEIVERVARLLARAHEAGWSGRDVHRGNVLVDGTGAVLLDPGTRPLGAPLSRRARRKALGRAAHGLGARPRDAVRALRAYGGDAAADVRGWLVASGRHATAIRRAYRRGRTRRASRDGLHMRTFSDGAASGIRRVDGATAPSPRTLVDWLATAPIGRPLKADGSVLVVSPPGTRDEVVAKRYAGRLRDRTRTPRAIRAFRRAYALEIREIACPRGVAAIALPDGRGLYVAERLRDGDADAPDLDRALRGRAGEASIYAGLAHRERRDALLALGRFLRRMHDADVSHRDLKAPNLVVTRAEGRARYALVDLDGARIGSRDVSWSRRARDLGRLDASAGPVVSRADRRRVLAGYLSAWRTAPVSARDLARAVARASRRKRAPSGLPR